ncbi:MAG: crotonase/enoyl-CoA hydratase family protein [Solirubrobacteraceae bacterium]|nr:crotonase/enoyl-CoA hydratase family protein [Solirubrobacteraceae bacterium]
MSEQRLRIDREADGRVAVVVLTRPEKHNALDRAMFDAIDAATLEIRELAEQGEIHAVVLRGEGKSFCSGLDVAAILGGGADFATATASLLEKRDGEIANLVQRVGYAWKAVPVPVIAALHGNVLGGGLQIALGADLRIATPDAKLSIAEIRWGLIPDMALTTSLPKLIGIDHAKELTFTGRNVTGAEAALIGLVTRTADDPAAEALALATEIAEKSPLAIKRAKALYDRVWEEGDAVRLATEEALQREILAKVAEAAGAQA